jgi:hypothetical protein
MALCDQELDLMRNIWINPIKFDPFGVESIERFITPDFMRGYSVLCPSGTAQSSHNLALNITLEH